MLFLQSQLRRRRTWVPAAPGAGVLPAGLPGTGRRRRPAGPRVLTRPERAAEFRRGLCRRRYTMLSLPLRSPFCSHLQCK